MNPADHKFVESAKQACLKLTYKNLCANKQPNEAQNGLSSGADRFYA